MQEFSINLYLIGILFIILGGYVLHSVVEALNLRHASPVVPEEFRAYYDPEKYRASQEYLKDTTRFTLALDTLVTFGLTVFILAGGFGFLDRFVRGFGHGEIVTGLIFSGLLALIAQILQLPFSVYRTFVIEEKYGFNRTTPATFALDLLKSWLLVLLIGAPVLALVLWFFSSFGALAWVYSWLGLVLIQLLLSFIAPVVIMPLFNTFVPMPDGELKQAIETYARAQGFKMKGLFTMDGSRRSTKSNAFFTGFGRFRRIVLFDTLIQRHTIDELVSVLAHEMGHYRKHHIIKLLLMSIVSTGCMFLLLSLCINNPGIFTAFQVLQPSVYASLVFFSLLYAPVSMIVSTAANAFSRGYEYEADAYAGTTYKKPDAMITALKKLSVDNLSNLTPHPLKVFLEYSHPPVLQRIMALRALAARNGAVQPQ